MKARLAAIAIGILAAVPATAGPAAGEAAISVVDYGIYRLRVDHKVKEPGAISGAGNVVSNLRLLRRTRTIFGQLGLSFGYRYRIADPALLGRRLTVRTAFPLLRNPVSGRSGRSQSRAFTPLSSGVYHNGYRFDFLWELAEGLWRFQLLDGDTVLHEEVFRVVIPLN